MKKNNKKVNNSSEEQFIIVIELIINIQFSEVTYAYIEDSEYNTALRKDARKLFIAIPIIRCEN